MTEDFRKPFTAPPVIFGVTLLTAIPVGLIFPWPLLSIYFQLLFGPLLIFVGVLLIRASMQAIKAANTTYNPFAKSTALTTKGIYKYTRNPGYLGLAVIELALAILLDNIWIAAATLVSIFVTTVFVIKLEEEKLLNAFGQEYTDFRQNVRRWI